MVAGGGAHGTKISVDGALVALEAHVAGRPMKILRDSTIGIKYFNEQRAALKLPLYVREDD